ncbi:MAG TPA: lamin tail domain-containing protein [Candidatus Paceibacterota bacterium]
MATKTKSAFLACLSLVLLVPRPSAAAVIVTEIMYDVPGSDAGHEWIEIYNDGAEAVSIAKWRLLEADTKHKITNVIGGDTIQPQAFAIIAANAESFRADSHFNGQLFDSAFSLANGGETISLLDASEATISSASYVGSQGAAGDGNSLNAFGNSFVPRTPTPGTTISSAAIPPSPPKETKTGKSKKEKASLVEEVDVAADEAQEMHATIVPETAKRAVASEQQTAAVVFSKSSISWWLAALIVSAAAGGVLLYSRSIQKKEWDIIEEIE